MEDDPSAQQQATSIDAANVKVLDASECPPKSIAIECENGGRIVISLVTGEERSPTWTCPRAANSFGTRSKIPFLA